MCVVIMSTIQSVINVIWKKKAEYVVSLINCEVITVVLELSNILFVELSSFLGLNPSNDIHIPPVEDKNPTPLHNGTTVVPCLYLLVVPC